MESREASRWEVTLGVRNVGGIERTEPSFIRGVTVLVGRNATNRTSLLRALVAALGSDDDSQKADAYEGHVELTAGGETYTCRLDRTNGAASDDGNPYLKGPAAADLFAFLRGANEPRRAVAREGDLRKPCVTPIPTNWTTAVSVAKRFRKNRRSREPGCGVSKPTQSISSTIR